MFNFTIERKIDERGVWFLLKTDCCVYYAAWYPDHKEPLSFSIWGNYGV